MDRRLFPFAELVAFAGIMAGGYTIVGSAKATASAMATSVQRDERPVSREVAVEVAAEVAREVAREGTREGTREGATEGARLAPTARPVARISATRPPVPLQLSRRAPWIGAAPAPPEGAVTAQAATAPPEGAVPPQTDTAVTDQTDKKVASDAAAKAMIEADGYKSVRAVVKAPDGSWRGFAKRGAVEVAVSVDDNGNVSTQ